MRALRLWNRPALGVVAMIVTYYALPLDVVGSRLVLGLVVTLAALALLAWAIVGQVRAYLRNESLTTVRSVAMMVGLVVIVFALGYFLLEQARPTQLVGVHTRTDALYFTLTTLTTVGYGDAYAAGQVARVLVSVQLVFDVVLVAALVSTLTGGLRNRPPRPDEPAGPSPR